MLLVIGDNNEGENKLREHGVQEFIKTPVSPENLADKILMLIAKKELKRVKQCQAGNF
jgi:response regulator RpfG family c-di-GMP phosphodiesterase